MKKTVKLSEDGFIRATELARLLDEGWTITQTDTPFEVIAEKPGLDEGVTTSDPQMLLD